MCVPSSTRRRPALSNVCGFCMSPEDAPVCVSVCVCVCVRERERDFECPQRMCLCV